MFFEDYGDMFGGVLGSIGKEAMGIGSYAATSAINLSHQKELADYTDNIQRAYTRDQYGLQKEGLVKSGYNPLLVLGGSPSQEAISTGSPGGQMSGVDLFQAAQTAKMNANSMKNADQNTDNNTNQTNANIRNQDALTNANIGFIKAQTAQEVARTLQIAQEMEMLSKKLGSYNTDRILNHLKDFVHLVGEYLPWKINSGSTITYPNGNQLNTSSYSKKSRW